MSLLRRRCMLHEEKQWDYEWYPVNDSNQFVARFIDVQAGDRVIINYYAISANANNNDNGYLYDGRSIGIGFCSGRYVGEYTMKYNSDDTITVVAKATGKLAFSVFHRGIDKDGMIGLHGDVFHGKYIKVRIER